MRRIGLITLSAVLVVLVSLIFPPCFGVPYNEYHSTPQLNIRSEDVTFHWEKSLLRGNWNKVCLWDWGLLGHCYISFSYSLDTSLDVPASLSMKYPNFLEPGQSFLIETKLETTGDRIVTMRPAIYFGIDLGIPLVKSFQATYGGQWNMTFNIKTKDFQQMLDKVWVGDFTNGQLFSVLNSVANLNSYVQLQKVDINSASLGTLVLGEIRVDLFRAILNVLKQIFVPPPLDRLVDLLDWLTSKFFKFSTGLIITPTISAYATCPIQTNSRFASVGTNLLQFDTDLSPKNVQLSIASNAQENNGTSEFKVECGPISFSYLFDVGWQYYFDIDIGILGHSLYQHTWTFDIYRGPSVNWNSEPVQTSLEIASKIDGPLQATDPSVDNGKVAIDMREKSGISQATLYYSTDKLSWNSVPLSLETGTLYSNTPISSVSEDTVVFYYFRVTDGNGIPYDIGAINSCFNYTLRAQQSFLSLIQQPRNLAVLSVVVVSIIAITGSIVWIRRGKKRTP